MVAEVTGRSRRIVRKRGEDGADRLTVENRAGSANLAETKAFMDDEKRILVCSNAGGTGRSYHADRAAKNQRLRVHYLSRTRLEGGHYHPGDRKVRNLPRRHRLARIEPPILPHVGEVRRDQTDPCRAKFAGR
jgi:hypothetical protein